MHSWPTNKKHWDKKRLKKEKTKQKKKKREAVFNISDCTSGEKATLTMVLQETDLHTDAACLKLSITRWAVRLQRRFLSNASLSSHRENCFPLLSSTREYQHSKFIMEDFPHFGVSPHHCPHVALFSGLLDHPCSKFSTRWLSSNMVTEQHSKEFTTEYVLLLQNRMG